MKSQNRIGMITVLAFPVLLTIGIILIPVVPDYADHALAIRAVEKTERWFVGHLLTAVAFAWSVLSSSVIVDNLQRKSYHVPAFILPVIALGAGLYAAGLGADGIGPIAVKSSGASPTNFFDGSGWWVSGTFMVATLFFGVGLISLVIHVIRSGTVKGNLRYLIFLSALVFVSAPAIPSGWVLYGEALAALGVFIPIGKEIGKSI